MHYKTLLAKSAAFLHQHPDIQSNKLKGFRKGGLWMHQVMVKLNAKTTTTVPAFNFYGTLKYGTATIFTVVSFIIIKSITWYLTPFCILVFYLVEAHFIFLFPLLIVGNRHPVKASFKLSYRLGLFHILKTLIPIAFYMLLGLWRGANPFKNWHLGCVSIIIWYCHETGNRI